MDQQVKLTFKEIGNNLLLGEVVSLCSSGINQQ
jgi:hypothetical protein